jgi:short-subunit dehydrogenase
MSGRQKGANQEIVMSTSSRDIVRWFSGKRVWVTGASSGLGAAFVEALAAAGARIVASAPEQELSKIPIPPGAARAEDTTGAAVVPLAFDLTDNESITAAVSRAWTLFDGIDVLINNAGLSQRSLFVETEPAVLERVLKVNLTGTMWLTRAVAERMVTAGTGTIVVISSYAALVPVPLRTAYSAAKAALIAMGDALRAELLPRNVGVTVVIPGTVRTEISLNAVTGDGSPHATMDPNQATGMAPDECARRILASVARGRGKVTVAIPIKLRYALFVKRIAPRLFDRIVARARLT